MSWHSILQPNDKDSINPTLVSDDLNYCFVAGQSPLSINIYSTHSSALISKIALKDDNKTSDPTKLINIHRHPIYPSQIIILISSIGTIYSFDFLNQIILSTYQFNHSISFSKIQSTLIQSNADDSSDLTHSNSHDLNHSNHPHLTIFLISNKSKSKPKSQSKPTHQNSILYAIKLDLPNQSNQIIDQTDSIKSSTLFKFDDLIINFEANPSTNWLGFITKKNIWILRLLTRDLFKKKLKLQSICLVPQELVTSISFPPKIHLDHFSSDQSTSIDVSHPSCDFFATGSISGKITLWHALSQSQWSNLLEISSSTPSLPLTCPTSQSHWHAHSVSDLAFTLNGSHLLSGGEEAVLVLWRLDDFDGIGTDSKTFLPRLPSPIYKISLIESSGFNKPNALITTIDGTLLIVDTNSMSLLKTLKLPKLYRLPAHYRRSSNSAILLPVPSYSNPSFKRYGDLLLQSSSPCGLQIIDGGTGQVLSEIIVCPKNTISRRDKRSIVEPVLLFVAIGGEANTVLATIDSWCDLERGFEPEITLKIWQKDDAHSSNTSFKVIGRVDNPHEGTQITSLTISSEKIPKIVTTSNDGKIKIWTSHPLSNDSNFNSPGDLFQTIKSVPLDCKPSSILKSKFSKDNSLLITLHRTCLSIWDAINLKFLKTLGNTASCYRFGDLRDFEFLGDRFESVFCLGRLGVGMFDLLSSCEVGFWPCRAHFITKHPNQTQVMISHEGDWKKTQEEKKGSKANMITLLDVVEKKAIMSHKTSKVRAGAFVWGNDQKGKPYRNVGFDGLVLVTQAGSLIRYGEDVDQTLDRQVRTEMLEAQVGIQSSLIFEEVFKDRLALDHRGSAFERNVESENLNLNVEKILEMPPHLVPPSQMIWSSLIQPQTVSSKLNLAVDQENKEGQNVEPILKGNDLIGNVLIKGKQSPKALSLKEFNELIFKNCALAGMEIQPINFNE
ncbi:hypothetical protein O181_034656 [Austropuccinia psidii MF-1]|uniref:WD repeat-containing protein 75 second beta-propeller domain-containing protein n=1 Tax=Austropuccinia psidii MF-1 TaxID=1389203 RepID=A0A9Q3D153_9BASI|nr:hypothetical protein [Austropuccinia psidii MF-1]